MNNFDLMVGGGISSLLGKEQTDTPGEFDFAAKSNPTVSMAYGGEARSQFEDIYRPEQEAAVSPYSDEQVAQALQESMKQGFSLEDSIFGAQTKYGIPTEQLTRAQELFTPAKTTSDIVSNLQAAGAQEVVPTTFETPQAAIQYAIKSQLSAPDALGATPQTFGQFNVTPVTEKTRAFDEYGSVMPASYYENLSDKTIGYNLSGAKGVTNKGVNYEASIDYDASGGLQGYTINYKTGRDSGAEVRYDASGKPVWSEAYDYSEGWRKPVAMGIGFIAAMYGIPGIGEALGATTAVGQGALGGAFVGGLTSAVSGAEGSDILKGAAVGAASGAVGQGLGKEAGEFAAKGVGGEYGNVIGGAVKGGVQALPGAIATGDVSQVGIGALMGGATAAGSGAISDALKEYGITPGQAQAGVNIARAISSGNTAAIINQLGPLTESRNINIASKAYLALEAITKGNPIAATAAIIQLGNAMAGPQPKAPAVQTSEASGFGENLPPGLREQLFNVAAMSQSGMGEEVAGLYAPNLSEKTLATLPEFNPREGETAGPIERTFNLNGDLIFKRDISFIAPNGETQTYTVVYDPTSGEITNPRVEGSAEAGRIVVTGRGVRPEFPENIDIFGGSAAKSGPSLEDLLGQLGVISGADLGKVSEPSGGMPGTSTGAGSVVAGTAGAIAGSGGVGPGGVGGAGMSGTGGMGGTGVTGAGGTGITAGEVIKTLPDPGDVKVTPFEELKPLEKTDLTDIINTLKEITIPTPPGTTTPTTTPGTRTPIPTKPTTKAAQTAALAAAASNLYALPGDLPLFKSVFYEMERQKELARQAKEIENADKDPYERLMELAEENPGLAVDELMKIIEGGQRG